MSFKETAALETISPPSQFWLTAHQGIKYWRYFHSYDKFPDPRLNADMYTDISSFVYFKADEAIYKTKEGDTSKEKAYARVSRYAPY